nr:ethylene-responsive transcription factor 3-like [Lolium perenne]
MPPRHRSSSGYRSVRARPNDTLYAEIPSGDERIGLGTFETAHEAARAYDAVAWCLGRSHRTMNFHDVWMREQAAALAPPPPAVTREQQQHQRELEQRLVITERDERLRLEWARQFPEDSPRWRPSTRRRRRRRQRRRRRRRRIATSAGRNFNFYELQL